MNARQRGFTLIELLIATGVLAAICMLIYTAFAGMRSSKEGVERIDDRIHEGREALRRFTVELSSAYLSMHRPLDPTLVVVKTAFIGTRGTPADRLDFNSFSNRRFDKNSHESDECELSYFGLADRKQSGVTDLVRRISPKLDIKPERGGRVEVLATDIDLFKLRFLDPLTGNWADTWDSTDTVSHTNQLPIYVHVKLVLNGGRRSFVGRGQGTLTFETKIPIQMYQPLSFAIE
ncbi:MAG TPA: prepilin-type N-terminal cleavage/methylation domain-containing protein [Polyangiaceae bacterium]|jgi:general secretion pathway protein J|nr:prepilin-type N-terminal cleavage/methylation domain-containing protein [Polyangiaceae bacterium]